MAATRIDISSWFDQGVRMGAAHMIVVCDTFDYEDYPVFVMPTDDFWAEHDRNNGPNMTKIMEVYDLALDKQAQLAERRAFHPAPRPVPGTGTRTPDNMPVGMLAEADQLQARAAEHAEATDQLVAEALAAGPLPEDEGFWTLPEDPTA